MPLFASAPPPPNEFRRLVRITKDFLLVRGSGHGLDELPNWSFYLNEKVFVTFSANSA